MSFFFKLEKKSNAKSKKSRRHTPLFQNPTFSHSGHGYVFFPLLLVTTLIFGMLTGLSGGGELSSLEDVGEEDAVEGRDARRDDNIPLFIPKREKLLS